MQRTKLNGTRRHRNSRWGHHKNLSQRDWDWSPLDDYQGMIYLIELDIGTPPQPVKVFVDTGSYELWVNPLCAGSPDPNLCQTYGAYVPKQSNTSTMIGGDFHATYGTGSAMGTYWSDTMMVSMLQIPSIQFAVANDTVYTWAGILGLGYSYPITTKYPTMLNMMVRYGYIGAPIFSIGVGGEGDGFSEIIFGGVNRWKYSGSLSPVPIWPPPSSQDPRWVQYWVNVTSLGLTGGAGAGPVVYTPNGFNMPMIVDTGSTLSYLREDLVAQIGQQLGATVDNQNTYWVDCAWRDKDGTVDFGFLDGKVVINVKYKDFIYEQYAGHCQLGVQPADVDSTNYVLGDTFIRGAYLVFDQQSDVIWLGQYYNCGDGVVTVGKKPGDVESATGAC
ncbi:Acid protease [Pleurostoma richardsiae]|uniref:Acid protease n=1 Tax=Pleurostoma richardsiae TaxID=41990 RepID=A0AA38RHJ5_9PEZI|nr:Acid protease [Pleurostoma richardsiae]